MLSDSRCNNWWMQREWMLNKLTSWSIQPLMGWQNRTRFHNRATWTHKTYLANQHRACSTSGSLTLLTLIKSQSSQVKSLKNLVKVEKAQQETCSLQRQVFFSWTTTMILRWHLMMIWRIQRCFHTRKAMCWKQSHRRCNFQRLQIGFHQVQLMATASQFRVKVSKCA